MKESVDKLAASLVRLTEQLSDPVPEGESAWKVAIVSAEELTKALRMNEPRVCKLCKCIKSREDMPIIRLQFSNYKPAWSDIANRMNESDICVECVTKLVMP